MLADRPLYYTLDDDGEPVPAASVIAWTLWFERSARDRSRIVAQDKDERSDAPDALVSTVFLGLDHAYDNGAPVLWETMILGGIHDGYQRRYRSRAAALRGHAIACALVAGVDVDDALEK